MATEKQVAANRLNGLKGGPKTPEGKAVVRLNARKHGIFAQALTVWDAEQADRIYARIARWLRPIGDGEELLVDKMAHVHLSMHRCAAADAEYFASSWRVADASDGSDPSRLDAWVDRDVLETSAQLFHRYDRALTNQFLKLLHEFRVEQRLRRQGQGQEEQVVFMVVEDDLEEDPGVADPVEKAAEGTVHPPTETAAGQGDGRSCSGEVTAGKQAPGAGAQSPAPGEAFCETNPICQNVSVDKEIGDPSETAVEAADGRMEAGAGGPTGSAGVIS